MIRAVITDCFGVLYPDPIAAYRHDGRTPEHTVAALRDIHERAANGEMSRESYIDHVSRLLQKPAEKVIAEFFSDHDRNKEALAYIGSLRPAYKTILLSNAAPDMVESRFTHEELWQYFDDVILSYQIQTSKPDPAIYRWACERIGVQPHEAIAVDDDQSNSDAAAAVGLHAVMFRSLDQAKADIDLLLSDQDQLDGL